MLKMMNEQSKETSSMTVNRTIRKVSEAVVAALYSFFLVFGLMKSAIARGAAVSSLKTMLPLIFIALFYSFGRIVYPSIIGGLMEGEAAEQGAGSAD